MSTVTFKNTPVSLQGEFPKVASEAPEFLLVRADLSEAKLADYAGKRVILNIFPSLDTEVCAMSVRKFNEKAAALSDTVVLCVSKDLPFAQSRFCTTQGIANVESLSAFRDENFGKNYGVLMLDGPLQGLLARAVLVLDAQGKVLYTQLVSEITQEPDYDAAIAALAS